MILTSKQLLFVAEYLVDLNATQAAIRAGYSERTAAEIGYENLRKPQIATAISDAMEARSQRAEMNADWVLEQLRTDLTLARAEKQHSAAIAAAVHIGKHIGMWPKRVIITDEDREAVRIAAETMDVSYEEALAEVERELREARA